MFRFQPGCCCGSNLSPCTDCCEEGTALEIKVTMPTGMFTAGTSCATGYCPSLGGEVYLNNSTLFNDCDWLLIENSSPACGGSMTIQHSVSLRKDTPSPGQCTVTFTFALTQVFVSLFTWRVVITDGDPCGELSLPYLSDIGDGEICTIAGSPGNVLVDFNP